MLTLITRRFIENFGGTPDPDLAYIVNGRKVTWAEMLAARRERQARRLEWRRRDRQGVWRPLRLTVRYFDIFIMAGWHAYLDGVAGYRYWYNKHDGDRLGLLKLFPLPPLFPATNINDWMPLFARAYQRGSFDGRPAGRLVVWARMTGRGQDAHAHELSLTPPRRL